ncbi:DUF4129 domain-containing protein [Streptomyces sp. NPDC060194]|uniref:DUF4129 domain-containing protein n=1 Tax=Streptomyces sp. NPDC060194 TaxID=3347069 RepID=UPI00364E10F5
MTTPREAAREAAERELSDPRYREHEPGLLRRALDAFWDWVDSLFSTAASVTPGGAVGLLVLAVVVIALAVALRLRLGSPRRAPRPEAALFADGPRSSADHRSAAERHAAAGHWTEACQERMRALVRALEERALLDPRPGRTADEAATDAGHVLPAHRTALSAAARTFDDLTYGGRTGDEGTYHRLSRLDTDLATAKPDLTRTPAGGGA